MLGTLFLKTKDQALQKAGGHPGFHSVAWELCPRGSLAPLHLKVHTQASGSFMRKDGERTSRIGPW